MDVDSAKRAARGVARASRRGLDPTTAGFALGKHVLREFVGDGVDQAASTGARDDRALDRGTGGGDPTRGASARREPAWPRGAVVAGFWPIGDEIDIRPLLDRLHAAGHVVALPLTPGKGASLLFRRWHPGMVLQPEPFGTMRPTGASVEPDILLIPLLAFDAGGGRLGYGGGFYDRTLAAAPHRFRLGCAFAAQQVDAVPVGPYDMRLHAVATEAGIIHCGG